MSDDEKNYIRIIIEFIIKFPFSYPKWFLLLCLLLLFGLIGLNFYQETCSDYPCPDGYIKDESKKDIECDSLTCNETDDKNKCCNKSIDCEGNWSDFSECSVECGGGTQTRTYNITTQPQYGGSPCPTSPERRACNTDACVLVDDDAVADDAVADDAVDDDAVADDAVADDAVADDAVVDDTGVGETVTCSTIPTDGCPPGYLYRTGVDDTPCSGAVCDIDGPDLNTCCEQIITPEQQTSGTQNTGNTDAGNAKCSSLTCPPGYSNKTGQSDTSCSGTTCDLREDISTCCKFCPDSDGDSLIGVNDLLSSLAVYGDYCEGGVAAKCLYSNRGPNKSFGVNDLLGTLGIYGRHCGETFDCITLQDSVSSISNVSSVFSDPCTSEVCDVTLTCNTDSSIVTHWSCNPSSGTWDNNGSDEVEDSINNCIGN